MSRKLQVAKKPDKPLWHERTPQCMFPWSNDLQGDRLRDQKSNEQDSGPQEGEEFRGCTKWTQAI